MLGFPRALPLRGLCLSLLLPLACSSDAKVGSNPLETREDDGGSARTDSGAPTDSGRSNPDSCRGTSCDAGTHAHDAALDDPGDSGACKIARGDGISRKLPVDIVWVIDDSLSMLDDITRIQQNMASFAQSLVQVGLDDYHIIVLNEPTLTLAPPWDATALGLDPMRFFPVSVVAFNDCLTPTVASFSSWSGDLRPDAALHFIMVTDDDSLMSWPDFKAQMDPLLDGRKYTVHAIVDPPEHCLGSTRPGTAYWEAAAATGGQQRSICEGDWSPTFTAIEDSIQSTAQIPCSYAIPDLGYGQTYDWMQVNVQHTLDGASTPFRRKVSEDDCAADTGWYYDNADAPTQVLLCPAACSEVEQQGGSISIEFVCDGPVYL